MTFTVHGDVSPGNPCIAYGNMMHNNFYWTQLRTPSKNEIHKILALTILLLETHFTQQRNMSGSTYDICQKIIELTI